MINECVPLNDGSTCIYRALMMFDHSMGWALTWALGGACEWARALTQALKVYWARTLPLC